MVCDMIFIYPLLDFSIYVIGSTPLLLLHYLIEKTGDSTHRRTCRWGWGAATPPLPPPLSIYHIFSTHTVSSWSVTMINITDHSVVIDKLRQDKSGQAL